MELTKAIAQMVVRTKYEDLPENAREASKKSILDTIGVMFPPSTIEKACGSLAEIVKEMGGKAESTLIGFGGKAPALMAALLNGSLAHPMDYDDMTYSPPHHPSANTVPAALAVAEKIGGVSGKDFITVITLGNDIGLRLLYGPTGKLLEDYPWFSISQVGVYSATVASAKLLKLDEEKMINALGLAFNRVYGVTEAILGPDTEMRAIRDGFTNYEGVLCALMAARGIFANKDGIEKFFKIYYRNEYKPERVSVDLGNKFRGVETTLKPWPCAGENHGYIKASLGIMKEQSLKPEQIEEATLVVGPFKKDFTCEPLALKRNPPTSIQAKFSLPFIAAIALSKGTVEISDFSAEGLKNPNVLAIAQRVGYRVDPSFGVVMPAQVEIKTKDGRFFSKKVEVPYGSPDDPLTWDDLTRKFKDCVRYAKNPPSTKNTEQLVARLRKLEEVKDMREVAALIG